MRQGDPPKVNARSTKVRLNEDVWELAVAFVAREQERNPLGRVTLQRVVNQAVQRMCAPQEQEEGDDGNRAA